MGQNDVFTVRPKYYHRAENRFCQNEDKAEKFSNIWPTRGLLLDNNKTVIKSYIFLAFWGNISALLFLLFRPTGFDPTDQTHFFWGFNLLGKFSESTKV